MSEEMMRWWRKMAYMTILRWVTGDGAVAKRILRGVVLLERTVLEGLAEYGLSFCLGGREWMVKWSLCHKGSAGWGRWRKGISKSGGVLAHAGRRGSKGT
jgi:hypothetical protein